MCQLVLCVVYTCHDFVGDHSPKLVTHKGPLGQSEWQTHNIGRLRERQKEKLMSLILFIVYRETTVAYERN